MLAKYEAAMEGSDTQGVLQVEAEVSRLIGEIERLEGRLRLLKHRVAFASLTVELSFQDRRPPSGAATSPFPWINALNVDDLLNEFEGRLP